MLPERVAFPSATLGERGILRTMSRFFLAMIAVAVATPAGAIPDVFFGNGQFFGPVIPAFPRFNANLTREFLTQQNWEQNEFPGPWEAQPALDGEEVKRMTAMPVVLSRTSSTLEMQKLIAVSDIVW